MRALRISKHAVMTLMYVSESNWKKMRVSVFQLCVR